jgi:hypothetical protein
MADEGLTLTNHEERIVAWRLIADLAGDWAEHIDWEHVPLLGEFAWETLAESLDEVARDVRKQAQRMERAFDIDAAYLLDTLRDSSPPRDSDRESANTPDNGRSAR